MSIIGYRISDVLLEKSVTMHKIGFTELGEVYDGRLDTLTESRSTGDTVATMDLLLAIHI